MNNTRRKRIDAVIAKLDEPSEELEALKEEEEEAYDNLPESLQESERGEVMQEAIDNLDEAVNNIADTIEYLQEAVG